MKLREHILLMNEDTSPRKRKELTVCSNMLSIEEQEDISSLRVGYQIARDRLIEEYIKDKEPWLYKKITESRNKIPIFEIEDMAIEFAGQTD